MNLTSESWRPQLIALDVDGTTVGDDSVLSSRLGAKLREIDALGVPVVFATGRSWFSTTLVTDQLGFDRGYCVCNNGAMVVGYPPTTVIRELTFDISRIIEVVKDYPSTVVAVENFGRGYLVSGPVPESKVYELHGELDLTSVDEMVRRGASRIIICDPEVSPEVFSARCSRLDLASYTHFFMGENWLEIASKQATKVTGLTLVTGMLGVAPGDVLAIGDSDNDMGMLAWAGRGVAMANALPEVKALADHVTGSLEDDGVLMELLRWFPDDAEGKTAPGGLVS